MLECKHLHAITLGGRRGKGNTVLECKHLHSLVIFLGEGFGNTVLEGKHSHTLMVEAGEAGATLCSSVDLRALMLVTGNGRDNTVLEGKHLPTLMIAASGQVKTEEVNDLLETYHLISCHEQGREGSYLSLVAPCLSLHMSPLCTPPGRITCRRSAPPSPACSPGLCCL